MIKKFEKLDLTNKSLLGVGPMSQNCIDAMIDIAEISNIPIQSIASRRQIENVELGKGYVNNWSTEEFCKFIKQMNKKENILITRDHGGPWQNIQETINFKTYKDALKSAMNSFKNDIDNGFDVLHIDTSIDIEQKNISSMEATQRACEIMFYCWEYASKQNKKIYYEIGTENQSIELNNLEEVNENLNFIKKFCLENKLDLPIYYVIQNSVKVLETENVGNFGQISNLELKQLHEVVDACEKNSIFPKAHNSDYLDSKTISKYPLLGIKGVNVAPEFGVVESKNLIDILTNFNLIKEKDIFLEISFKSKKWEKWMKPNSTATDFDKAIISGHYVFSTNEFLELKQKIMSKLSSKLELDLILKESIKEKIKYYLNGLGWVA